MEFSLSLTYGTTSRKPLVTQLPHQTGRSSLPRDDPRQSFTESQQQSSRKGIDLFRELIFNFIDFFLYFLIWIYSCYLSINESGLISLLCKNKFCRILIILNLFPFVYDPWYGLSWWILCALGKNECSLIGHIFKETSIRVPWFESMTFFSSFISLLIFCLTQESCWSLQL